MDLLCPGTGICSAPFVRVGVDGGGTHVRAPFVNIYVPRSYPAPYFVPPMPTPAEELPPPADLKPLPKPPAPNGDLAPPQPVQPNKAMTLEQFANSFQPKAGNYEVSLMNPVTKAATPVRFTLPEGTPRRVQVRSNQLEFNYGPSRYVRIEFDREGALVTSHSAGSFQLAVSVFDRVGDADNPALPTLFLKLRCEREAASGKVLWIQIDVERVHSLLELQLLAILPQNVAHLFVPGHQCDLRACRHARDLKRAVVLADREVRMVRDEDPGRHPGVDVALDRNRQSLRHQLDHPMAFFWGDDAETRIESWVADEAHVVSRPVRYWKP